MVLLLLLQIQVFFWVLLGHSVDFRDPFGLNLCDSSEKFVIHLGTAFFEMITSFSHDYGLETFPMHKRIGTATACWFGADNADSVTESTGTIGTISISPNILGAYIKFPRLTEL